MNNDEASNQAACQLCARAVANLTLHHLVPRSRGKKRGRKVYELPTAWLCPACHRQLHVLFSNRELEAEGATIEQLRRDPRVQKFLRWIRKQDPNKQIRVRR